MGKEKAGRAGEERISPRICPPGGVFKGWKNGSGALQIRTLTCAPREGSASASADSSSGAGHPDCLSILSKKDSNSWSAVTISIDSENLIIINSLHSKGRQSSDISHELAHMLLVHKPGRMDVSEDGLLILDSYDLVQEKEAEWLSGCLLLPREALLHITRKSMNVEEAENRYHVSKKMMLYRQGVTGVNKQFNRARGRA